MLLTAGGGCGVAHGQRGLPQAEDLAEFARDVKRFTTPLRVSSVRVVSE
jgi:hypothetical protein